MSTGDMTTLQALARLRVEFTQALPGSLDTLEAACRVRLVRASGAAAGGDAKYLAHGLAGSGATFGYPGVSELARQLEGLLGGLGLRAPSTGETDQVHALLAQLRLVAEPPAEPPAEPLAEPPAEPPAEPVAGSDIASDRRRRRLTVGLVEDDRHLARDLRIRLRAYGYRVTLFTGVRHLETLKTRELPNAWLVDLSFPDGPTAGLNAVLALRERTGTQDTPLAVLSGRDDLEARLVAVRAGASAYLTKPAELSRLTSWLAAALDGGPAMPLRVLIVEDDPLVAAHQEAVLKAAGFWVHVQPDRHGLLESLEISAPDVLLLDQYLPDCKGTELAAVVRQDPRWIGLPIIFLSSEGSVEVQLTALRVGGDTFLQKPLAPEALVELVRARALRSRGFREHLFRDDLTGLYRRSYIEQRLKAEVSRAQRSGEPLAFAMLDLDQLKSVNDSYGHQVGDQVLRTLARILSERLRSSDVVSRLGGEEFGVLLPEADASRAASILNVLRARFAKKIFDGGGGRNFQVTFSCGVAEFPLCHDVEQLQIGANQALGRAKGSGRNCVVVSR